MRTVDPGEVFLSSGNLAPISGLISGFAQLVGIALQYGVPLPKPVQARRYEI